MDEAFNRAIVLVRLLFFVDDYILNDYFSIILIAKVGLIYSYAYLV